MNNAKVEGQQIDLSIDGHIHTRLCNHAKGEMEDYVKAGIAKGLAGMIFLEHLETDILTAERIWLRHEDFEYYFNEGERLKQKYKDSIDITLGIEAGLNPMHMENLETLIKSYPCEHVGLSYHFLFDGKQHLNMVSRRQENINALAEMGINKVLNCYFDNLLLGVKTLSKIDVVCHIDAVLRHYPNLYFHDSHWKQLEKIFDAMVTRNIAMEINTSGFVITGSPYPKKEVLTLAQQKNIRFIAGSDAHCPEQVGRYFNKIPTFLA